MHILFFPSWYPDYPADVKGVFFRDQALALLKYGHQVGVIAPKLKSLRTLVNRGGAPFTPSYELDEGIPTYRRDVLAALPRVPLGNYWLIRKAARALLKEYINRHGKPDILHAHSAIFGGAVAAELSREYGIPMVLTEHSTGFARNLYADWQLKLAGKGFSGARRCIAVSPALGQILGEAFPQTKNRWHWIPNVVADRFNASKVFNRKQDAVRFLNLALMTEKKGQFDLIEAFKIVADSNPSAELWFGGDGPILHALKEKASELGIADSVHFLGMVPPAEVPQLLEQVDIMVVSSHYETFGVVAAEALMAGVPVIATRCGGPECIVEQGDGLIVPVKNPKALGSAMKALSDDLESFDPGSIAARARARFSGEAIAGRLTREYEEAIASSKKEPEWA
jgi:L-malate glycosyltransferase